jgi:hypothetical protein
LDIVFCFCIPLFFVVNFYISCIICWPALLLRASLNLVCHAFSSAEVVASWLTMSYLSSERFSIIKIVVSLVGADGHILMSDILHSFQCFLPCECSTDSFYLVCSHRLLLAHHACEVVEGPQEKIGAAQQGLIKPFLLDHALHHQD